MIESSVLVAVLLTEAVGRRRIPHPDLVSPDAIEAFHSDGCVGKPGSPNHAPGWCSCRPSVWAIYLAKGASYVKLPYRLS